MVKKKKSACQCRRCKRCGFNPWVRNISWRRKWKPLQHSCLEHSMDRGAWQATDRGVAKSQTKSERTHTRVINPLPNRRSQSNIFLNCKSKAKKKQNKKPPKQTKAPFEPKLAPGSLVHPFSGLLYVKVEYFQAAAMHPRGKED